MQPSIQPLRARGNFHFPAFRVLLPLLVPATAFCNPIAPMADFDGDGRSDMAIARSIDQRTVQWGFALSQGGLLDDWSGWALADFGNEGDKFYTGDFNGDGLADMARVARRDNRIYEWGVRYTTDSPLDHWTGFTVSDCGNDGDFFFIGDFDGDGMDDIAQCRPESETIYRWGISYSGSDGIRDSFSWELDDFGSDSDRYYVGDFDGDGVSDIALARPVSTHEIKWGIRYSHDGFLNDWSGWIVSDFGNAYDEFHVGDFDGNGRSDLAVARQTSADDMVWGIRYSKKSGLDQWGGWLAHTPVVNHYTVLDYDGDGVSDLALRQYEANRHNNGAASWGVYTSQKGILDHWSGWVEPDLGTHNDRYYPGNELGNTIVDCAERQMGVTGGGSTGWVDYYTFGHYTIGDAEWWCSEFVCWAYERAGLAMDAGDISQSHTFLDRWAAPWLLRNTTQVTEWFENEAHWVPNSCDLTVIPRPGDYVRTGNSGHSRMVQRVVGDHLYTIEGNAGNRAKRAVCMDYRTNTDNVVDGFGRLFDLDREDWRVQASGTNRALRAVDFTSDTFGFAVGHRGTGLRTEDGGDHWIPVEMDVTHNLHDVDFIGPEVGYAVGARGTLLKSVDGGRSWNPLASGTSADLNGVAFYSTDRGVIVGSQGTAKLTEDGGTTWRTILMKNTPGLWDVQWGNHESLTMVGNDGFVAQSFDAGESWIRRSRVTSNTLYRVAAISDHTVWAVGAAGTIVHSDDFGDSWSVRPSGTTRNLYGVHFTSEKSGHIVGTGATLLATTNGGGHWTAQESSESEHLIYVTRRSGGRAWAVGTGGQILEAERGGGWH